MEPERTRTHFWNQRWDVGNIPWDFGGTPANLVSFLIRNRNLNRVLIVGCGSGYEVRAFHEAGHDVTAIDFSTSAVERARQALGPIGDRLIHGSFFNYDFGETPYEIVYDRGFLCSLPHGRRLDYAARVDSLLMPGGRLVGMFLYGTEPEPPPFPLTEQDAEDLLCPYFQLTRNEPVISSSVHIYEGVERWQEWEKL